MAVIESMAGTALNVDPGFGAARVSLRPPEVTSWISVGATSGNLAAIAANGALFSLRSLSANLLLVRRVGVGFVLATGYTTAQTVQFGLTVARAFSASDGGGQALALTGNTSKHRTSQATLSSVDCRIAASAVLGAGTKALDAIPIGAQAGWAGGPGTIITPQPGNLLSHDAGDYPLVLAQNGGINIAPLTALGAGGSGVLVVNIEIAEAAAF